MAYENDCESGLSSQKHKLVFFYSLIEVWLLLQCSKQSWQNKKIASFLTGKKKTVLASVCCCYKAATPHPTLIPQCLVKFLPMITQHKLRASPLTSKSWATLEWGPPAAETSFPFSTGYTTPLFPKTQSALVSPVAAQPLARSAALRFLPDNRNNDREGWVWISVFCLEQNKICWDGFFLLGAQRIPFILLSERCSVKTTKVI